MPPQGTDKDAHWMSIYRKNIESTFISGKCCYRPCHITFYKDENEAV